MQILIHGSRDTYYCLIEFNGTNSVAYTMALRATMIPQHIASSSARFLRRAFSLCVSKTYVSVCRYGPKLGKPNPSRLRSIFVDFTGNPPRSGSAGFVPPALRGPVLASYSYDRKVATMEIEDKIERVKTRNARERAFPPGKVSLTLRALVLLDMERAQEISKSYVERRTRTAYIGSSWNYSEEPSEKFEKGKQYSIRCLLVHRLY